MRHVYVEEVVVFEADFRDAHDVKAVGLGRVGRLVAQQQQAARAPEVRRGLVEQDAAGVVRVGRVVADEQLGGPGLKTLLGVVEEVDGEVAGVPE